MAINFKILTSFVKAVELESLSSAAQCLQVAQPALSQHIRQIEEHFQHRVLLRTNVGVKPTSAGKELYRHALKILEQLHMAEHDVRRAATQPQGNVNIGLATFSSTSALAIPLLLRVRSGYPDINLFLDDSFGLVLSEMIMAGRMDLAVIYGDAPIAGVRLCPLLTEELVLIGPPDLLPGIANGCKVPASVLEEIDLLLPGDQHFLRGLIETAFARIGIKLRVLAEIESADTLRAAINDGLGATILPMAFTKTFSAAAQPSFFRIADPQIKAHVSLCTPENAPMSEAAAAVAGILKTLAAETLEGATPYASTT